MKKYLTEMLEELNENPKLALTTYKDNSYLKTLFEYTYHKDKKFNLPKGNPPYIENPRPMGLTETDILFELRRFRIYCRKDLTPLKIESLFIALLEGLHPKEAEIMLAVKDQNLNRLYKKLTKNFAIKYGYIVDDNPKKIEELETEETSSD